MDSDLALIRRVEAYYDLVPRAAARAEERGPFTLFIATGTGAYYARPSAGGDVASATVADVEAVLQRQRELGVPEQLEWIDDLAPKLAELAEGAGLEVSRHPLLVLNEAALIADPGGIALRIAPADDRGIPLARAAVSVGFQVSGSTVSTASFPERDAARLAADAARDEHTREQIAAGLTVMAIAAGAEGPVGGGTAAPRGDLAELMGIATLPAYRRRGIGSAITAALTAELRQRGVDLAFLTAADDAAARLYERAGYRQVATACIAQPPD